MRVSDIELKLGKERGYLCLEIRAYRIKKYMRSL
jgi:hypothetical protein